MSRRRSMILSAVLAVALGVPAALLSAPARAEDADEGSDARARALALRVMEVTGVTAQGDAIAEGLLSQLRPVYPTVPDEVWKELEGTFALQEIIDLSIPIYVRNFSEQELADLLAFYQSPIGQKVVERMPIVMQENGQAFSAWNLEKYGEVMQKLQDKGYAPDPELAVRLQQLGVRVPSAE